MEKSKIPPLICRPYIDLSGMHFSFGVLWPEKKEIDFVWGQKENKKIWQMVNNFSHDAPKDF